MLEFLFRKLYQKSDDMTFWEHAEALRVHIMRIVIALLIFSVGAFFFKHFLFDEIVTGPLHEDFMTYGWICRFGQWFGLESFCFKGMDIKLINIDLAGQFRWHMIISIITGCILTFPYAIWQMWLFIKPALSLKERKNSRGIILIICLLFFIGVVFGYLLLLPLTIIFLSQYELSANITNQITISSYISTTILFPLSTGLVFELPVFVYFLSEIELLTPQFLKKYRKHAVVIILIIAGIITPSTDIISQLLVAIPLYILYEISISVSKRVYRKKENIQF